MPTECSADQFEFAAVEGRTVVAAFDGGAITSDAGALLLGQTDRAIRLSERFAACFSDTRTAALVEHPASVSVHLARMRCCFSCERYSTNTLPCR